MVIGDMRFYLEKILAEYVELKLYSVPGNRDVFVVNEEASALLVSEQKIFHMTVVQLLYLSKRARPDIITVVGFLCNRVKAPMVEDKVSAVVMQTGADSEGLRRDWVLVGVDPGKNKAYAFQWFGLSALVTLLYVWFQWIGPLLHARKQSRST